METPVNVTVINKNNFTIHSDDLANSFNSNFGGNLLGNQTQSKCCYIVHPEVCPESPNICFRRKHAECSYLCTSDHILIREDLTANNTCIPINVYPNYYCGQYITEGKSLFCFDFFFNLIISFQIAKVATFATMVTV